MNRGRIGTNKDPHQMVGGLKRQLIFLSAIFAIIYLVILVLPGLTSVPVDWVLEQWRGVKFVDGWTPGLTVYATLLAVLPAVYIVAVVILFAINRRRRSSG